MRSLYPQSSPSFARVPCVPSKHHSEKKFMFEVPVQKSVNPLTKKGPSTLRTPSKCPVSTRKGPIASLLSMWLWKSGQHPQDPQHSPHPQHPRQYSKHVPHRQLGIVPTSFVSMETGSRMRQPRTSSNPRNAPHFWQLPEHQHPQRVQHS